MTDKKTAKTEALEGLQQAHALVEAAVPASLARIHIIATLDFVASKVEEIQELKRSRKQKS